jgi:hypothetical protein
MPDKNDGAGFRSGIFEVHKISDQPSRSIIHAIDFMIAD